jgi:hypothetical protein
MVASEPYELMVQEGYFDFHNKNQANRSEIILEGELKVVKRAKGMEIYGEHASLWERKVQSY